MNGGTAFIRRALHNPKVIASYILIFYPTLQNRSPSVCVYYFAESFQSSFRLCQKIFLKNIFCPSVDSGWVSVLAGDCD